MPLLLPFVIAAWIALALFAWAIVRAADIPAPVPVRVRSDDAEY